jgi:hypothetical protein
VPAKLAPLINRLDGSFLKVLSDIVNGPLSEELLDRGAYVNGTLTVHDDMDREHTVSVRYDSDVGPYIVL